MKLVNILGIVLAIKIAGVIAVPASVVNGNSITLSDAAVQYFGGSFNDLFGNLTSLTALGIDLSGNLKAIDLKSSEFLLTGQDPFFDASRDVHFLLFTNKNTDGVNVSISDIEKTSFDAANPTRFIIHGYSNGPDSAIATEITKAYLKKGGLNIIVVDYSRSANDPIFINARLRVNVVSTQIANFINSLVSKGLAKHDQIVIVGHSLGAQTAGNTGKKIVGGKIKAIIAMDPAQPLFPSQPTKASLQASDAQYVEAIHTNAGILGIKIPIGHADFYPNGGTFQPDCWDAVVCPHIRSYDFFAESINDNKFKAIKCASYSEFCSGTCTNQGGDFFMGGEPPNYDNSGVFALNTAGSAPYALG